MNEHQSRGGWRLTKVIQLLSTFTFCYLNFFYDDFIPAFSVSCLFSPPSLFYLLPVLATHLSLMPLVALYSALISAVVSMWSQAGPICWRRMGPLFDIQPESNECLYLIIYHNASSSPERVRILKSPSLNYDCLLFVVPLDLGYLTWHTILPVPFINLKLS